MNDLSKAAGRPKATWLEVGEEAAAQRIDNFLLRHLKGVPKSHVYQVLRSGQVRVNSVQQVRSDTLRVNGAVAVNGGWQQRGFYCDFRADGRITAFDIQ